MMLEQSNIIIDVHLNTQDPAAIKEEIRAGLFSTPRTLPTKYLYDDQGSALFERICESPEYYQTRTEHALLKTVADEVITRTGTETLVELGSGAATKTRVLLDAMARANHLRFYVPFDFSEGIVRRVARELVEEYDGLRVHGSGWGFPCHLEHLPDGGPTISHLPGRNHRQHGTSGRLGVFILNPSRNGFGGLYTPWGATHHGRGSHGSGVQRCSRAHGHVQQKHAGRRQFRDRSGI